MAPLPQNLVLNPEPSSSRPAHHEDVVISGMAALMPGCKDMEDFAQKLYAKVNLAKCDKPRWNFRHPELPPHIGKIDGLDRFDSQFFMVNSRLAHFTDVMSRKLLELSYEALFDAGVAAGELNGKRVGVFVAVSYCESEKFCSYQEGNQGIAGCNRAMFANRISYWLNSNGPSITLDCNGCGSIVAMEQAFQAIRSGRCESALVGGSRVLLHPQSVIHYGRQVKLNETGVTKSYDLNADGETLSEGISVVFLQKQKDARRIYATISHIKTGYNAIIRSKDHLAYTPNQEPESFELFLEDFYKEAGVPTAVLEYVEGFGSALPKSDKDELEIIDKVFTKDRKTPLLVGTVMSNVGYTEATSGLSSLMKLLFAYQKGKISANINFEVPREDVEGIKEGRLRIVAEEQNFERGYTALNTFSLIGAHGHVLLKGNYIQRDPEIYKTDLPYLLTVSGRHESAVEKIVNWIKSRPLNIEEIALLNNMHKTGNSKHLARGFGVYKSVGNETKTVFQEVKHCDTARRTLWFVYSGMGSQWVGMGRQLMCIPIFADTIQRCNAVLSPKGVDIVKILTSPEKSMFDNILHSFIGIAAVQIGITDILKAVGITPDYIIGHSVGELGCAYADGCVTTEEMISLAYYRGLVSIQTPLIRGSMAAVGLGYKQILKLIPPEIEVACRNGPDSCTISGPAEIMKTFVNELSNKGVFAKEVACSNIAYHSKYIATAGPKLLEYCRKVIQSPKLRSDRWLSTSVPQEQWNGPAAKFSSAEYHVNNLLNPVLFEETCQNIPHDAVLIEIAPHGLLQAILKRSLSPDCDYIPMTRRNHPHNAEFLMESIGKIYMKGYDVDVSALNPKVEYPVSTTTPTLAHLVEWDHSRKWTVCDYVRPQRIKTARYKPVIAIFDEEYKYLDGHWIQGKRSLPYAAALLHVWETLAMSLDKKKNDLAVNFQNVHFYGQPVLLDQSPLHLKVELHKGNGRFEVHFEHGIIADGVIVPDAVLYPRYEVDNRDDTSTLAGEDIYMLLRERGYDLKDEFRCIKKSNESLTRSDILWKDNWVTFIEGIINVRILNESHDGISKLDHIQRLSIDARAHLDMIKTQKKDSIELNFYKLFNIIQCGGVTIENISFKNIPEQKQQNPILKAYQFVPFFQMENNEKSSNLYLLMQIVSENVGDKPLTVLKCGYTNSTIMNDLEDLLRTPPEIKIKTVQLDDNLTQLKNIEKPDVIIVDKYQCEKNIFEVFYNFLPPNTFLITTGVNKEGTYPMSLYKPVASMGVGVNKSELAIWRPVLPSSTSAITVKTSSDFNLLRTAHADLPKTHKLLVFTSYPPIHGLKELVQEMRSGPGCQNICATFIDHKGSIDNLRHTTDFELAFNVLSQGTWGGLFYMPKTSTTLTSSRNIKLQSLSAGNLSSISWVNALKGERPGIPVTAHFAGLNVYDARRAVAEIASSDNECFGMDFSGVTERGCRVMGLVDGGAVTSLVIADPQLTWPVPAHWSLQDAATVPLPYCLAFYCLGHTVNLRRGQSMLVQGGAGALGQAVISIALHHRCRVFTTVADQTKKRFLRRLFPDLPADHIGNSRDETFSDMVLLKTEGQGCEIVISCAKGELKNSTLKCCAHNGTTIDTVQIHTRENFNFGMFFMNKCRNYVPIDFISMFKNNDRELMTKLHTMVADGIRLGYVRPLSRVTYAASDVTRALTLLATSKHRGRVLVDMRTLGPNVAVQRLLCSPDKYQLILCQDDDFGLNLAAKLIKQGAKKLLIHYTKSTAYLEHKIRIWKDQGVQVHVLSSKICDKRSIQGLLKDCSRFGFVEGVYILGTKTIDKENSFVADVDEGSRDLFSFLKYFAVISKNQFVDYNVHLQRVQNSLPSTFIQLHNLEKVQAKLKDVDGTHLHLRTALDGIEVALCRESSAWLLYGEQMSEETALGVIAKIAGLDSTSELEDSTTLEELRIDADRATMLQKRIECKFGVVLPIHHIPKMKVSDFKKLQVEPRDLSVEEGLPGHFSYVDSDEIRANCDLVLVPTRAQTAKLRANEFRVEERYLYIVPGIEGNYKRFRQLSERVKLPAVVLQPGLEAYEDSIDKMAEKLVQVIWKKMNLKGHFYLLGYEFGVFIALRMATILEKSGLSGTVYCIGGTPEEIRNLFTLQLNFNDTCKMQNIIIHHVYNKLSENKNNYLKGVNIEDDEEETATKLKINKGAQNDEELHEKLKRIDNWQDKVNVCIDLLKGKTTHTHQYKRDVLETLYSRIRVIMNAQLVPATLKSKIVFMFPIGSKIPDNLKLYSNDVAVHSMNSTLSNMTRDLQVTTLINKYLSEEVLTAYENSNHCETVVRVDDLFSSVKNEARENANE